MMRFFLLSFCVILLFLFLSVGVRAQLCAVLALKDTATEDSLYSACVSSLEKREDGSVIGVCYKAGSSYSVSKLVQGVWTVMGSVPYFCKCQGLNCPTKDMTLGTIYPAQNTLWCSSFDVASCLELPPSCVAPLVDNGSGGCNCPSAMGGGTPGQAQSGAYTQCTCAVGSPGAGISHDVTSGAYSSFSAAGGSCDNPSGAQDKCPDGSAPVDGKCESCKSFIDDNNAAGKGVFVPGSAVNGRVGRLPFDVCIGFTPPGSDSPGIHGCYTGIDTSKSSYETEDEQGNILSTLYYPKGSCSGSGSGSGSGLALSTPCADGSTCSLNPNGTSSNGSSDGSVPTTPFGLPVGKELMEDIAQDAQEDVGLGAQNCVDNDELYCDVPDGGCPECYTEGWVNNVRKCAWSCSEPPDFHNPDTELPPLEKTEKGSCMDGYSFSSTVPLPTSNSTYYRVYSPNAGYCVRVADTGGGETGNYSWDNAIGGFENVVGSINKVGDGLGMLKDGIDNIRQNGEDLIQQASDFSDGFDSFLDFFVANAEAAQIQQKKTNNILDDVADLLDTINKMMSFQCTTSAGVTNYVANRPVNSPAYPCYVEDTKANESLDNIEEKLGQLGRLIEEKCEENKRCEVSDLVTQDWLQSIRAEMDNVRPIFQNILTAVEDLGFSVEQGDAEIVDALARLEVAAFDLADVQSVGFQELKQVVQQTQDVQLGVLQNLNEGVQQMGDELGQTIRNLEISNNLGHSETKSAVLGMSESVNSSLNKGFTDVLEKLDDNCAKDRDCCEEILEQLRNMRQELNEHCGSPLHQNQNTGIGCKIYSEQLDTLVNLLSELDNHLLEALGKIESRFDKLCTPLEPCDFREFQAQQFIERIPETLEPLQQALDELEAFQQEPLPTVADTVDTTYDFLGVVIPFTGWRESLLSVLPVSRFANAGTCSTLPDVQVGVAGGFNFFAGRDLCKTFSPLRALLSFFFFMSTSFGVWKTFVGAINDAV